jgi:hypothetical protein
MENKFLINEISFNLLKSDILNNNDNIINIINTLPINFIPFAKPIYRIILALCTGWFEQQNFIYFQDIYNIIGK